MAAALSAGCQSDYAGQTLPSPYWQVDDVQYFRPGPEFKLTQEAIALKRYEGARQMKPVSGPLGPQDVAPAPGAELPGLPADAVPAQPPIPGAPAAPAAGVPGGEDAAPPPAEDAADPFAP